MTIEDIVELYKEKSVHWTDHILGRLRERGIGIDDIVNVINNGEIIEQYPSDYPSPSCLMMGYTIAGQPLHIVCGSNGLKLWFITAYFPNPIEWTDDFKKRRNV